jgi:5'-deoxynucleotidase YfbR-like HD superfamily hydrolase
LGLLHDAPEYLTGDISGPLKKIPEFRQIVKKLEKTIEEAIYKALKIEPPTEAEEILVKKADNVAQRVEAYNFMMSRGQNWTNPIPISLIKLQEFEPPQPSTEVYLRFLTRYETLTRSLDRKNNEI